MENTNTFPADKPSRRPKVIISGGGTGGHIFPALTIADVLSRRLNADILFVGAENRMEMTRVPEAGYEIIGLPVAGFDRKRIWRNFGVLLKLFKSLRRARKIVRDFKPDIAILRARRRLLKSFRSTPKLRQMRLRSNPATGSPIIS